MLEWVRWFAPGHFGEGEGAIEEKTTYKYDEKGNKVEQVEYAEGGIEEKIIYKYDEKGDFLKLTQYKAETFIDETRFIPTSEITREYTYWD